jgi:surface antigen/peptidoglycan hydrolase CwlO-like protein
MKLNTTTPVSISSLAKRASIIFVALVIAFAGAAYFQNRPASADEYDDKIRSLQADMARYQKEADRLNAEATTLANALAQITNEKNAIQAQVNLSQAEYDKLVIQITDTEKEIANNQDALGDTIADLYVGDDITTVEMLASSQNIGEYLDKQEYRNSVKDELSSTIKTVKELKAQLTSQKKEVEKVLAEQEAARDALAAKEAEQANLLARTQNDEANYQGMIKDSEAQIAEARATQATIRARLNSTGGYTLVNSGQMGGYPWGAGNCAMWGYLSTGGADGNGGDGYGYGCRQCASYVAWRIAKETGVYYRWGNAKDFTNNAVNAGYQYLGMNPQPGSIAVMNPAKAGQSYGHIAWVEAVSGDQVTVSQYNYDYGQGYGMYSMMTMSKYAFDHFVKIK